MTEYPVELVLDSGAYSCWKRQETLDLNKYIEFIEKWREYIFYPVNLDVIPGSFGRVPSDAVVEASAKQGWENLQTMRAAGIDAMPVFHQGEQRYWLEKMIGEGYDYIGISPANDRTTKQKSVWLDEIFGYLCGKKGYPAIRTHGFGVTSLPLLFRYPWFSADSATWFLIGAYGGIMVPVAASDGSRDFTKSPHTIQLSNRERASTLSMQHCVHYENMGDEMRKYIDRYLGDEEFDLAELRSSYKKREKVNCRFFKRVTEVHTPKPFRPAVRGFFSNFHDSKEGQSEPWGKMRIIFTINTSQEHSDTLTDEKVRERLISYYYFKDRSPWDMDNYVKTGRIPLKGTKKSKPQKSKL